MDPLIYPHYKNGFNDYYSKSLKEIFSDPVWEEMTNAWEVESINKYGKQTMNLCHRKCTNSKWEALCNIKDDSASSHFKSDAFDNVATDDTKVKKQVN
jgi:hypothetical protein